VREPGAKGAMPRRQRGGDRPFAASPVLQHSAMLTATPPIEVALYRPAIARPDSTTGAPARRARPRRRSGTAASAASHARAARALRHARMPMRLPAGSHASPSAARARAPPRRAPGHCSRPGPRRSRRPPSRPRRRARRGSRPAARRPRAAACPRRRPRAGSRARGPRGRTGRRRARVGAAPRQGRRSRTSARRRHVRRRRSPRPLRSRIPMRVARARPRSRARRPTTTGRSACCRCPTRLRREVASTDARIACDTAGLRALARAEERALVGAHDIRNRLPCDWHAASSASRCGTIGHARHRRPAEASSSARRFLRRTRSRRDATISPRTLREERMALPCTRSD
jgi:hypothetical protein